MLPEESEPLTATAIRVSPSLQRSHPGVAAASLDRFPARLNAVKYSIDDGRPLGAR
jgi:hypothetical protein